MRRSLYPRQEPQPECGSGVRQEDYNLPLHVGALFVILCVSAFACAFPLIVTKVPGIKLNLKFLFVIRHFGTGVLLATAFVHLLPTAFISLTDPCLPSFWNEKYPAMAGAIALASVFLITSIEMLFSPGRHACAATVDELSRAETQAAKLGLQTTQPCAQEPAGPGRRGVTATIEITKGPLYGRTLSGRAHSNGRRLSQIGIQRGTQNPVQLDTIESAGSESDATQTWRRMSAVSVSSYEGIAEKEATEQRKKALIQCVMLEVGILFHSVFIGMALAVAVGHEQIILLVAIVFHQTFEGLALGSRIASVGWQPRALQPWLMALAYGCTTPLGQAIGIATRNLYDPDSQTGLLVVGIMNAISSGLLTFNSLIDLLSEDFLSDQSWKTLRGNKRMFAFSLVFFGAFCMALIGAWA